MPSILRAQATLFGQAIGDALGAFYEFKDKTVIFKQTGGKVPPAVYRETIGWNCGEWTDDTEMALGILDAYIQKPGDDLDLLLIADRFIYWAQTDGRGMGTHTWHILKDTFFLVEPFTVSEGVWEDSGRNSAPNGAVMRTSVVGMMRPWDIPWTVKAASDACKVTHWDPRCVASSVAVSVAIAHMIETGDSVGAVQVAINHAAPINAEAANFINPESLSWLELSEGGKIGYTYKCMGAGFWALHEYNRIETLGLGDDKTERCRHILMKVIGEGGDADTNGAVAGAMLGAASGIPWGDDLVNGMPKVRELKVRLSLLQGEWEHR